MELQLKPSRLANRSTTNTESILEVLKTTRFCTVSISLNGQAFALPTAYCLYKGQLMIHGSVKSYFLNNMDQSQKVCITVFQYDGLVLAASAFHHSVNYRSVVIYSSPTEVTDRDVKLDALRAFTDQLIPGRWEHLRPINEGEINATKLFLFSLDQASLKFRDGGPSFEKEDANFPVWTGVLPATKIWQAPVPDPNMKSDQKVPDHVENLRKTNAY